MDNTGLKHPKMKESSEVVFASLGEQLYESLLYIPGAPEREKIADALLNARWFHLDEETVHHLSQVVEQKPHLIEGNLDFLGYPGSPIWIEYDNSAKVLVTDRLSERPLEEKIPTRIGALVSGADAYDDNPETLFAFIAWQFEDGSVHFSPATLLWDLSELTRHAAMARNRLSKVRNEVLARLLDRSSATISVGLEEEIRTVHVAADEAAQARAKGMRDSTSEVPFLLATLLLLNTRDTESRTASAVANHQPKAIARVTLKSEGATPLWKRALLSRQGFSRKKTRHGEILRFQRLRQEAS